MVKFFKAIIFDWRLKHARRRADRLHALYGRKFLVITLRRRPVVVSKQQIKTLIADGVFRKGIKPADIEAKAIYRTF